MLWTALICGEHNDKKIIKTHSFECTWKNFRHCMIAYHNWDTCNEMKFEGSQSNISFPLKEIYMLIYLISVSGNHCSTLECLAYVWNEKHYF